MERDRTYTTWWTEWTVDREILLDVMKHRVGISGVVLKWFESYLSSRTQHVQLTTVCGNELSDVNSTDHGIPQGSLLGGILFSIYLLPLFDILTAEGVKHHAYADDIQIYHSFNIAQHIA